MNWTTLANLLFDEWLNTEDAAADLLPDSGASHFMRDEADKLYRAHLECRHLAALEEMGPSL